MKKLLNFFIRPNQIFLLFLYLLTITLGILSIIFVFHSISPGLKTTIHASLGITFFYSVYTLVAFEYKYLRTKFYIILESAKKLKYVDKFMKDYQFRTIIISTCSSAVTVGFIIYNSILGAIYNSKWNIFMSLYFIVLLGIKSYVLIREKKISSDEDFTYKNRLLTLRRSAYLMCLLSFTLIIPCIMIITDRHQVILTEIYVIVLALYIFIKLGFAVFNFRKTRKKYLFTIKALRNVNLSDALVSLLTLANTMIYSFNTDGDIKILKGILVILSILAIVFNLIVGILTIKYTKEITRRLS